MKLFSCWAFGIRHADSIHKEWRDARQLLGARQAIERELIERSHDRGRGGNYKLQDVLELLMTRTGAADRLDADAIRQSVVELVQIELEQERFVSFPNPMAKGLLAEHGGRRLAFLCEYHMEAADLAQLLHYHGLGTCAELGLTTADLAGFDDACSLFELAVRKFGFAPDDWLHVGDVALAERLGARRVGAQMRSRPSSAESDPADSSLPLNSLVPEHIVLAPAQLAAAMAEATAPDDDLDTQDMVRIGVEAAPLFAGFALWLLEQALRNKSEHIYFFTREGHFLKHVYDAVMDVYDAGLESPPYSILSVSRLATFAPSLADLTPERFADVWAVYNPQTVAGFFATLGIESLCDVDELARFGLKLDDRMEAPQSDERFVALLAHPPFRARVMPVIDAMRGRVLQYLASEGLSASSRRVSTVDIGWHGSIQSNLGRLLPQVQFQGLYLGLDKRKTPLGPNVTQSAYVADLRQSTRHADLVTYVAPMEFLCSAEFGSTVGYSQGDRSEPIRMAVDQETQRAFANVVAPFQAGVVAGARKWAHELRTHGVASKDLTAEAVTASQNLIHEPTDYIAHGFAETTIDETFGFGRTFRLPRHFDPRAAAVGFSEGPSVSSRMKDTVRGIPWPQAFAHYARSNRVIKLLVPAAIRAGKRGRRLHLQLRDILANKNEGK